MLIGSRDTFGLDVEPVLPGWALEYGPEKTAWAGLAIWVGGENLCRHQTSGTDRVEQRVFVPLAPLADWLVRSWPAVSFEERPQAFPARSDPRRTYASWSASQPPAGVSDEDWYERRTGWWQRHFAQSRADGAVLPDLGFVREGDHVVVGWAAVASLESATRREGSARVELGRLSRLRDRVHRVGRRQLSRRGS